MSYIGTLGTIGFLRFKVDSLVIAFWFNYGDGDTATLGVLTDLGPEEASYYAGICGVGACCDFSYLTGG